MRPEEVGTYTRSPERTGPPQPHSVDGPSRVDHSGEHTSAPHDLG